MHVYIQADIHIQIYMIFRWVFSIIKKNNFQISFSISVLWLKSEAWGERSLCISIPAEEEKGDLLGYCKHNEYSSPKWKKKVFKKVFKSQNENTFIYIIFVNKLWNTAIFPQTRFSVTCDSSVTLSCFGESLVHSQLSSETEEWKLPLPGYFYLPLISVTFC